MMILNRTKSSMMMAAIAAVMTFAAIGCTEDEPKTPAEQLLQAAQDGNKRIDALLAHHEVLTSQIVSETLAPIDTATAKFNAEVTSWQDNTKVDPKRQGHEIDVYTKAGSEIANLTAKLSAEGFALTAGSDSCGSGGSGSDCGCDTVTTPTPTPPTTTPPGGGSGSAAARVAVADDTDEIMITQTVYWKRYLCKGACGTAQVACTVACGPIFVGGVTVPAAVACVLGCTLLGALCQDACGESYPNCR